MGKPARKLEDYIPKQRELRLIQFKCDKDLKDEFLDLLEKDNILITHFFTAVMKKHLDDKKRKR